MKSLESDKSGLECGALINEYDNQNKRKKLLLKYDKNKSPPIILSSAPSLRAALFVM